MPRTLGSYSDVRAVLDKVVETGSELTLEFSSCGLATNWVMRAYRLRKLLHEKQAQAFPGQVVETSTPYDSLILRHPKQSCEVKIVPQLLNATVRDAAGNIITLEPKPYDPQLIEPLDDPLLLQAEAFKRDFLG